MKGTKLPSTTTTTTTIKLAQRFSNVPCRHTSVLLVCGSSRPRMSVGAAPVPRVFSSAALVASDDVSPSQLQLLLSNSVQSTINIIC